MSMTSFQTYSILLPAFLVLFSGCRKEQEMVQRPERIFSKRVVLYDSSTYAHLAQLWQRYYEAYPSEDAYANWMYAARYAGAGDYEAMLKEGLSRYPANPTILYLSGLTRLGGKQIEETRRLLEQAASLDRSYDDPWYPLIDVYMQTGDRERTNVALRHLLESGAIADEVMDFSYNMFTCLEKNAVLITNGDNDTYPGWILTRVVGYRPDVRIVNRSLLNTEWYPALVIGEGVPAFVTQESLTRLREDILTDLKSGKSPIPEGGPFGDVLIEKLIEAATREHRPVYFSCTMMPTKMVQQYVHRGRNLGLVTLVTPSVTPYPQDLRRLMDVWLGEFRNGGLDSWQLRHADASRAGRQLIVNYASAIRALLPSILEMNPQYRLGLFRWYEAHLWKALPREALDESNRLWCSGKLPKEIEEWCSKQGYTAR